MKRYGEVSQDLLPGGWTLPSSVKKEAQLQYSSQQPHDSPMQTNNAGSAECLSHISVFFVGFLGETSGQAWIP